MRHEVFVRGPWACLPIALVGVALATTRYTAETSDLPVVKAETVGISYERLMRIPGVIQVSPYNYLNIRPLLSVVVSQAVTDSLSNQKPTVMGYRTVH